MLRKKRPSIFKPGHQSNIASKQMNGIQRYTIAKNKYLTSLTAVELSNPQIIVHAVSASFFIETVQISQVGVHIGVSQTEHSMVQMKATYYMLHVNT